jgi:8-oxo-dGTP diphosphatase
VQLDYFSFQPDRRIHLFRLGIDEKADSNPTRVEPANGRRKFAFMPNEIKPAFGRDLGPFLGHKADFVRLKAECELENLRRVSHLEIELRHDIRPKPLEVAILHVTAISAQMRDDATRSRAFAQARDRDRIGFGIFRIGHRRIACLPKRSNVVDIDPEVKCSHRGSIGTQPRETQRTDLSLWDRNPADVMIPTTDWKIWQPRQRANLLFVLRGDEILLIRKKRGFGAGKINGPGGKIDPGETALESALRETHEELGILPLGAEQRGELHFQFRDGFSLHCLVFVAYHFDGEPEETDEAIPLWTPLDAIPYGEMWADDRYWLPLLIRGESFIGYFEFDGEELLSREIIVRQK